ncbi:hypothetical protein [uncultured Desulfobacter sp.]|uniref:hypothetical protein n=1 Tax=uncultured Desulfobacter sp. TaxID=240139 RepID=UPI003748A074
MKNNTFQVQSSNNSNPKIKLSPFGRLFRIFASWFGFTGLYAAFSVCPFCGQQGCPVGMVSAGTVGAFLALCLQDWKRLFLYIKNRLTTSQSP